jgi:hypothetical protein
MVLGVGIDAFSSLSRLGFFPLQDALRPSGGQPSSFSASPAHRRFPIFPDFATRFSRASRFSSGSASLVSNLVSRFLRWATNKL